jgi:hypothetical protein
MQKEDWKSRVENGRCMIANREKMRGFAKRHA